MLTASRRNYIPSCLLGQGGTEFLAADWVNDNPNSRQNRDYCVLDVWCVQRRRVLDSVRLPKSRKQMFWYFGYYGKQNSQLLDWVLMGDNLEEMSGNFIGLLNYIHLNGSA